MYYVTLSFMLFIRIVYFSDALVHYQYIVYFMLQSLPILFVYSAGTILAFGWRNLYLYVKAVDHKLTAEKLEKKQKRSKLRFISLNLLYFIFYDITFILAS